MLERRKAASHPNAFEEPATRCESCELLGGRVVVTVDPDGRSVLSEQMVEYERVDRADCVGLRFEQRYARVKSR